jgi:hypothetical protein
MAANIELAQRADDPLLQCCDEQAEILPAAGQVQHDIGNPLAGAVIGILAAAPGLVDGKAVRGDQILIMGAGAGRIERRMLDEPDALPGGAGGDGRDMGLHLCDRIRIGDRRVCNHPFDRWAAGFRQERGVEIIAEGHVAAFGRMDTGPWWCSVSCRLHRS